MEEIRISAIDTVLPLIARVHKAEAEVVALRAELEIVEGENYLLKGELVLHCFPEPFISVATWFLAEVAAGRGPSGAEEDPKWRLRLASS